MVRSNLRGDTGSLLGDFRRLNVAFSRAKKKMIIVGSASTMRHSPIMLSLLQLASQAGWTSPLPPAADQLYEPPPPPPLDRPVPCTLLGQCPDGPPATVGGGGAGCSVQGADGEVGRGREGGGGGRGPTSSESVPRAVRGLTVGADKPITANILQEAHDRAPIILPTGCENHGNNRTAHGGAVEHSSTTDGYGHEHHLGPGKPPPALAGAPLGW